MSSEAQETPGLAFSSASRVPPEHGGSARENSHGRATVCRLVDGTVREDWHAGDGGL